MTESRDANRRLERILFRARPSLETVEYDGWILRFADGYTKRANSVNPHFGSSFPVSEKIARCETLYRQRGLPTIFRLTPFSEPDGLDRALERAGYALLDPSLVMTADLGRLPGPDVDAVLHVSGDAWFAAFDRLRRLDPADRTTHRRIVETAQGDRCYAIVRLDAEPIACGLGVLVEDTVGLFDLHTAEAERRRGHGAAIVGSILRWAHRRGARTAALQVHGENEPAIRLYRSFGFEVAYRYGYRIARRPGPSSTTAR
jgi:GNAT superfamily N-acetyltransferase